MKPTTLIFCGQDGNAGKAMAAKLRSEGAPLVLLRDAASFVGLNDDPADRVVIMPDVSTAKRSMISEVYRDAARDMHPPQRADVPALEKRRPGRPRKADPDKTPAPSL